MAKKIKKKKIKKNKLDIIFRKETKLFWIILGLWIITIFALAIVLTTPVTIPKQTFYCKATDCGGLSSYLLSNCVNSILTGETGDTKMSVITLDITNLGDICRVDWIVEESITGELKGASMICKIPMERILDQRYFSSDFVNYCEGTLKDIME